MGFFCRCRFWHFHVVNNEYTSGWGIYAIGGSEDPTILSEDNHFYPAAGTKQVTKRISDAASNYRSLNSWNWKSAGDVFPWRLLLLAIGSHFCRLALVSQGFQFLSSSRPPCSHK